MIGALAFGAWVSQINGAFGSERGDDLKSIVDQDVRQWTDVSGDRHAAAKLLAANERTARLEKASGKVVKVALKSLSESDRHFIRFQLDRSDALARLTRGERDVLVTLRETAQNLASIKISRGSLPTANLAPIVRSLAQHVPASIPPNAIYVRISRSFLNRQITHHIFKRAPVNDCILGTSVQGNSQTAGRTDLLLVPDSLRAHIEVRVTGIADATTVGTHHPVWIFTRSRTAFQSSKHILVDDKCMSQSATRTQATTHSSTTGITTCLGPFLERIVLRKAWQRVSESRSSADSITASHTAQQVDRELDQAVNDQVTRIRTAMTLLDVVVKAEKFKRPRMRSSSTKDYLQVIVLRDDVNERDISNFVAAPSENKSRPDIELNIHSAIVFSKLLVGDSRASFQPVLNSPWYQWLLKFSSVALWQTRKEPLPSYQLQWSDDREWLKLEWNAKHRTETVPMAPMIRE